MMREDKLLLGLLLLSTVIGLIYILGNVFTHQYPNTGYLSWQWFVQVPLFLGLGIFSLFARKHSPRMAFLTWTYSIYFFMVMALSTLMLGIETTPFQAIDPLLVKADLLLGFHQLAVLNWTYAHHWILNTFNFCYSMMGIELGLFPIILALMMQKKAVKVYLLTQVLAALIGFSIYYFFPTTAPASMFMDPHFALQQHDTFIKFFEIHHHLPITTTQGGLIAFPSFHVIWSVLLAYAFKDKKYLFYPIAIFNAIIIASTVFLGWHYLTDVIGGFAVSALAIWMAETIYRRYILNGKEPVKVKRKESKLAPAVWNIPLVRKETSSRGFI